MSDGVRKIARRFGDTIHKSVYSIDDITTDGILIAEKMRNFCLTQSYADWGTGDEEIFRIELEADEQFVLERIELAEKGGGAEDSDFTIEVEDVDDVTTLGTCNLNAVNTTSATSTTGTTITISIDNSTGGDQNSNINVIGKIITVS